MRVKKMIVDLTLRVVVHCGMQELHDDAVGAILTRALQADIPPDLQTVGFISAEHTKTQVIHEWEEEDYGDSTQHISKTKSRLPKVRGKKG